MDTKIGKQTRRELLEALCERYNSASKIEKTKILNEFIDIAGCHRKHAIRLLTGVNAVLPGTPKVGRKIYSEAVREALVVLWEAADRICGKRLKVSVTVWERITFSVSAPSDTAVTLFSASGASVSTQSSAYARSQPKNVRIFGASVFARS